MYYYLAYIAAPNKTLFVQDALHSSAILRKDLSRRAQLADCAWATGPGHLSAYPPPASLPSPERGWVGGPSSLWHNPRSGGTIRDIEGRNLTGFRSAYVIIRIAIINTF